MGTLLELMQEDRSKIMNSSAFSCGDRLVREAQHPGNALPPLVAGSLSKPTDTESLTCNAVYTKRPHAFATGQSKLK
jgi:hypothetical protein